MLVTIVGAIVGAIVVTSPALSQRARVVVPIALHADAPDEAWIAEQLEHANTLFASAELSFAIATRVPSHEGRSLASIDDRAARDALGDDVATSARGEPTQVNVFLTDRLVDVDDPPNERMGVHWRRRRRRVVHYVIVSRRAWPTTLAHELGHYFGNPHSPTPNNIMSYDRDGTTPPFFDAAQLARIRTHARRYARDGLEAR